MASHIRGAHSGQYASWAAARKSGAVQSPAAAAPRAIVSVSGEPGFSGIISMLQQQGAAIDAALAALRGVGTPAFSARPAPVAPKSAEKPGGAKRKLSPEGRARLIEALKRRWAKAKTGGESAPAAAAPRKRGRPRKVQG